MDALTSIKSILGIEDDSCNSELSVYLELAQTEIIAWSFGKNSELTELPAWTQPVQIMAVVSGWNQKGGEGELHETVDGVTHTFSHSTMIGYIHDNLPSYARLA